MKKFTHTIILKYYQLREFLGTCPSETKW